MRHMDHRRLASALALKALPGLQLGACRTRSRSGSSAGLSLSLRQTMKSSTGWADGGHGAKMHPVEMQGWAASGTSAAPMPEWTSASTE